MSLAAQLREISSRTGISVPTLMNRYHNQGLRGAALEVPIGSLRRGRKSRPNAIVILEPDGFRSLWPSCSCRTDDQVRNDALRRWARIDAGAQLA